MHCPLVNEHDAAAILLTAGLHPKSLCVALRAALPLSPMLTRSKCYSPSKKWLPQVFHTGLKILIVLYLKIFVVISYSLQSCFDSCFQKPELEAATVHVDVLLVMGQVL